MRRHAGFILSTIYAVLFVLLVGAAYAATDPVPTEMPKLGITVSPGVATPSTVVPAPTLPITIWTPIIILLVPLLLAAVKKYIPARWYDRVKPGLLVLAPLLGMLGDWLSTWATGQAANPAVGLAMGAVAVFVREAVDQVRKSPLTPDSWTPEPPETKTGEETSAQKAGTPPVIPPRA